MAQKSVTVRLAEQTARADAAEKALDEFKNLVRDRVIQEAEDRGWCDEVDNWLDDLGLPNRHGDMPTDSFAVVRLKNDKIYVLADNSSKPWYNQPGNEWITFADAQKVGLAEVIYDGSGTEYTDYNAFQG